MNTPPEGITLNVGREKTWQELTDPERIQRLIVGFEYLENSNRQLSSLLDRFQQEFNNHIHKNGQIYHPITKNY